MKYIVIKLVTFVGQSNKKIEIWRSSVAALYTFGSCEIFWDIASEQEDIYNPAARGASAGPPKRIPDPLFPVQKDIRYPPLREPLQRGSQSHDSSSDSYLG